ncbi:MAG: alpha-xylosidase [Chloroflexi bacterium]|nr:alpha-xylosidase [Chloroflexota bacterium]MCI0646019.1 alpha-xylosidase [Chloroflexota bacterium]MCI0727441.1 alpha-xylosidase [Chloroflexota bacterium]
MKFTDGRWLMRKGVQAAYPAQVHDVEVRDDSFTVYAPTGQVRHRGDTLGGPLLTVVFSSPMPDVVRVQLTHLAGQQPKRPQFALLEQTAGNVTIANDDSATTLTSGRLSVRVPRVGAWSVEFAADGRVVTTTGPQGMGIVEVEGEGSYIHEQLSLGVGEYVYGLGERFTAHIKNGQVVECWNRDGGTGSEQAYKNIPFYLTNRGYGVFANHPENVSFEVASEKVSRVQFSVAGQSLDYFVIFGPTPKEVLEKYTALTGRPALPPAWSFGLWLTTSFTTSYDEDTVTSFIQGMADRDLSLHVFHFDCFWMKEFHWCDFEWDARTFPDPAAMLKRLKERDLRICVWINPYIAQRSPLFVEGLRQGYLLKQPNGDVWQTDQWQPGMGIVDFTNPAARQWFGDKLRALVAMGVDCFKTDFGERIPTDVVYHDGSDPATMHNYYSYLYNATVFEVLREQRGDGQAVLFARSATAGGQQFPVHWGGDSDSNFESMAESLRGGLSLGLSGFGFWSHDIGGFAGTPPADVYKRWIAFGLLSSHSRLHGNDSYRVPWLFDEEAVGVLRLFTRLKCRLMPYPYAQALAARDRGIPLMRAMLLEFPDDPACDFLDRQYMLGESLLVAPVFSPDGAVVYYLPAGRWTNFLTGEVKVGPGWMRETHGMMTLPLLVRPNSMIAVGSHEERPDYEYSDGVTLQVYELADGEYAAVVIPSITGDVEVTFAVKRVGRQITVERQGMARRWQLLLAGIESVRSAEGCTVEHSARGALVIPSYDAGSLTLDI